MDNERYPCHCLSQLVPFVVTALLREVVERRSGESNGRQRNPYHKFVDKSKVNAGIRRDLANGTGQFTVVSRNCT
jgi:hypothetical protein